MTKRTLGVVFLVALICLLIFSRLRASFIFIFMISAYLGLGLSEEVVRYAREGRRKRREAKLKAGQPLTPDDEDEIDDEQEVRRELGLDEDEGEASS